ncbi:MAG: YeeE/YedE family protein [Marinobacter sp.]|uniref:YeeE/YedE family protein n=1 Tax=Marinobacter sp. TaxID=50741 RepID=UPI00299F0158|nr:YeeE/YedE family protein [Marinobacter sp.]MDX1755006.1 YeeE/YedE family protein [Marinobacter sp.]
MITIDWTTFTPWTALAGGLVIGVAAALLILLNGRVAGISGILAGILTRPNQTNGWRLAFIVGLLSAPFAWLLLAEIPEIRIDAEYPMLIVAGLLVGLGTRYGSGCTSGHGVCGISRLSPRSLVATLCFMTAGFVTVYVLRHLIGGV